jgi:serine/tyrosine/threonine adenylyltransferase
VMNTDNMTISGETIDYGPCAFMDRYDPATVFSSIDRHGRYAYGNQPQIAQWNIARFAETLLPLLHPQQEQAIIIAEEAIQRFPDIFKQCWRVGMRAKLGLLNEEPSDAALIDDLLTWMHAQQADYTNMFRSLSMDAPLAPHDATFAQWHARWHARRARQNITPQEVYHTMCAHNPAIIARNHRVEEALDAAVQEEDFSLLHGLLEVLRTPYDTRMDRAYYEAPPPDGAPHYQTFCGT